MGIWPTSLFLFSIRGWRDDHPPIMFFLKGPLPKLKGIITYIYQSRECERERERERGMAASIPTTLPYGDGELANSLISILY
jgi:hypothetical protein